MVTVGGTIFVQILLGELVDDVDGLVFRRVEALRRNPMHVLEGTIGIVNRRRDKKNWFAGYKPWGPG